MPAERQALAQFTIVVQLAVEHDGDIARLIPDRLVAADQVDDAEPPNAQCQAHCSRISGEKALIVRTTMAHRGSHGPDTRFGFSRAGYERDAADAAHATA